MVTANLAHYHLIWGFIIYVDRLKMFLKGHRCNNSADETEGSFEVAFKKIDLAAYIMGLVPNPKNRSIGRITDWSSPKIEFKKDGDG